MPNSSQRPWDAPEGFLCLYESYFKDSGLWFPLPKLFVNYCFRRKIAISQLSHAAVRNIVGILTLAAELRVEVDTQSFEEMATIKRVPNNLCRLYVGKKSKFNLLTGFTSKFDHWERSYFFVKINEDSVLHVDRQYKPE